MWHKKIAKKNGQNLIEYALVVAVVASAMLAMSTYVFRSIQATQQMILKEYTDSD
jgi:Flp pilus assembly pilin Flp